MNKPIGRQAKDIIFKVYKYFDERKRDRSSSEYENDINLTKTVSQATGVSKTTIKKIVKEGKSMEAHGSTTVSFQSPRKNRFPKKKIDIDGFTEGVIRRKVVQFYTVKKKIPSLQKLNAELKAENIVDCSREYLRQTLHRLGFRFLASQSKRKLLIERHDIMRLRWQYIQNIKNYRKEGKPIIFLDETYVNQSYVTPKCWQLKKDKGAMKDDGKRPRLIIVHAGSRNGFVNNALLIFKSHTTKGDYYGDMNTINFQKWINEKLLPNIPQNSVVVMDTAAYHSSQFDRKPTMTCLKTKMQEWLAQRGIEYDSSLRKCDLIKIINEQITEKKYKIDEILKEKGHTVLRLPLYHHDLNPIELVLGDVKGDLERVSVDSSLEEKKRDLESLFLHYSPENWCKCDDHVIKIEDEYYESDRVFDDEFDSLVNSINEEDDDDDGEDDDAQTEEEYETDMEID